MWFEYKGFTVHWLGLYWYLILGPAGYRGYETSTKAARKTIDGVIAGQCVEQGENYVTENRQERNFKDLETNERTGRTAGMA